MAEYEGTIGGSSGYVGGRRSLSKLDRSTSVNVSLDSKLHATKVPKLVSKLGREFKAESQSKECVYTEHCLVIGDTIFFKTRTWMGQGCIKLGITYQEPSGESKKHHKGTFQLMRTPARYRVELEADKMKIFRLTDGGHAHLDKAVSLKKGKMPCWLFFKLRCGHVSMLSGIDNDAISPSSSGTTEKRISGTDLHYDESNSFETSTENETPKSRESGFGLHGSDKARAARRKIGMAAAAVPIRIPASQAPPIPARPVKSQASRSESLDTLRQREQEFELQDLTQERIIVEESLARMDARRRSLTDEIHQLNVALNKEAQTLRELNTRIEERENEFYRIQPELAREAQMPKFL